MVELLEFPKILDPRGNLTFLQYADQIPFEMKRIFWTYDVPGGEIRGGHAYKNQHEVIIALSGSFDVVITHPDNSIQKFQLNRSYYGLYVPAMVWRHMENFSTNAVGLHLSSSEYNESDYIRSFDQFASLKK
ncbi:sugar 3,4-ketoisomerase [Mongoliibacter ruber]|uniref:WxcM-like protein n=1 Tax=Mongoliibacter ruber TaxID=1750599 RepID=A0A2T0WPF2_9BACT|nr:FdtA/QdtA family cupin domain-containing protein [Mongoliibacter ruber]PRY88404.1 WxcM-like protein [Mongoliibacter ruber]